MANEPNPHELNVVVLVNTKNNTMNFENYLWEFSGTSDDYSLEQRTQIFKNTYKRLIDAKSQPIQKVQHFDAITVPSKDFYSILCEETPGARYILKSNPFATRKAKNDEAGTEEETEEEN